MSFKDQNFCLPIRILENDRIKLVPFDPAIHASPFYEGSKNNPELFNYMFYGPFTSAEDFVEKFYNKLSYADRGLATLAIFDKTKTTAEGEPKFAGMSSYLLTDANHLKSEIGHIVILPEFQRTHITSNMVGLMLHYALDLPKNGGLGLRRVQWRANAENKPSVNCAKRMGFAFEGIFRWDFVLPEGKPSHEQPKRVGDSAPESLGRHTAVLSICWDDWELGEVKKKIDAIVARR